MRLQLGCKQCGHLWSLPVDEPQALARLSCPACNHSAAARPSEDLASALEDALCQLWWVGQSIDVEVTLSTQNIPQAFLPVP